MLLPFLLKACAMEVVFFVKYFVTEFNLQLLVMYWPVQQHSKIWLDWAVGSVYSQGRSHVLAQHLGEFGIAWDTWVHIIMRWTRAEYKQMLCWVIQNQEKLAADWVSKALNNNKSCDSWDEVRWMWGQMQRHMNVMEIAVGVEEICWLFHEKYQEMYQSVLSDEGEIHSLRKKLHGKIIHNCQTSLC